MSTAYETQPTVPSAGETVLQVKDLTVQFPTADGLVSAVNGLSYEVQLGKTLAIVGESGSGKSVSSMAVMGLHDPKKTLMSGSINLDGTELVGAAPDVIRKARSKTVSMIFQDPQSSFHPFKKIGPQLAEAYRVHNKVSKDVAMKRVIEMLDRVGIPSPDRRAKQYPHEFSGGMRQRAMIALGLINDPKLLIADEPTTALDVTVQAQILDLMSDLQKEFGSAIILITHDLAVVAEVADDVLVMYGGRCVEYGTAHEVLANPRHPYSWGLLGSVPKLSAQGGDLQTIPGLPPSLINLPTGCSFHPRCAFKDRVGESCSTTLPDLVVAPGDQSRRTRCHLADPAEIFDHEIAATLE
ncbi:ABC transporter ATP-binding protein [Demetria terragena]|uniref:ABC transporter ATP-binding protein n=1 Tax=Demetria terragena TaxID=63959 RepID=UPI00037962C1|nr:ABC transporter ATP-binding protein [Demetria terragena]